jgi:hypothetical protein
MTTEGTVTKTDDRTTDQETEAVTMVAAAMIGLTSAGSPALMPVRTSRDGDPGPMLTEDQMVMLGQWLAAEGHARKTARKAAGRARAKASRRAIMDEREREGEE